MNFENSMNTFIKKMLQELNIDEVSLYISSDMNLNKEYMPIHFMVSQQTLYVIDEQTGQMDCYQKKDIDQIQIEYFVTVGAFNILKGNKRKTLAYFSKAKSQEMAILEKYLLRFLNGNLAMDESDVKVLNKNNEKICPKCHRPYEPGTRICKKCSSNKNMFLRLLKYGMKYKKGFIGIFILLVCSSIIGFITPIMTGQVLYDEVLNQQGSFYDQVLLFVIVYTLLKIIGIVFDMIYGRTIARLSTNVCYDLKVDVFQSMQRLSLKFYHDKETGDLMGRVVWDVDNVFDYIVSSIPSFFKNLLQIVGILAYLFVIQPLLTLLIMIPIPIVVVIFIKAKPRVRKYWEQNRIKENKMISMVSDTLEGFRVVKVFSGSKKEVKKFEKVSSDVKKAFTRQRHFNAKIYPITQLIISFSVIVAWGIGGYFAINSRLDYGELATFITGLNLVYMPLEFIVNFLFDHTNRVMNCARRIFEIIDGNADIIEKEHPIILKDIQGKIEFRSVDFAYEAHLPILKNISFTVEPNQSLGIVGKTGVGKTTIVNLLTRLYDVVSGQILIDGINIKDIELKSLHQNISMISQDTYLFKGSILDNIRYARPEATFEEVIEAAKMASAHEFIMKLPNGYDTLIGEGEINLSGGERQRLSIARAVLLNSKIIIFDEATAAMDTKTEKMIQEAIYRLQKNKTVIMIAHRLSTLKDVDHLIIIENKEIVEEGTMQELIQNKKQFYELYRIQKEALKHIGVRD